MVENIENKKNLKYKIINNEEARTVEFINLEKYKII